MAAIHAPLDLPLEKALPVARRVLPKLKRLGIRTLRDLLWHIPARYDDFSRVVAIRALRQDESATIQGRILTISNTRTWKKRMMLTEAVVQDQSDAIKVVWFNQPFLAERLKAGSLVSLSGKLTYGHDSLYLSNPAYELLRPSPTTQKPETRNQLHTARLVPVYPETEGLSSRWLRFLMQSAFKKMGRLADSLPEAIRKRKKLLPLSEALHTIHFPASLAHAQAAKRRLAFDEVFLLQLGAWRERLRLAQENAPAIPLDLADTKRFLARLPFALTFAQKRALWEILQDLARHTPMNRLLEGEVGSGKTVVAAIAARACVKNGYQVTVMTPTEILARQHFATFQKLLPEVALGLCLGAEKRTTLHEKMTRAQFITAVEQSEIPLVIGTHALIQKDLSFPKLALVVIDEQHRFGVEQRAALMRSKTTNASESTKGGKIVEKDLSYKLGGIFFRIQDTLGRFCREKQYGDALEKELQEAGILYKRECPIPTADKKSNFVDFIVNDRVLIDLKAKRFIEKDDYYQMKRYLEISGLELGLSVNFQDKYLEPKRVLNPKNFVDSDRFVGSDRIPHFLSMTATPIPRTLALTLYGDLDISLLDELPRGRREIETRVVPPALRQEAYEFIRAQVRQGRQAFVICPRIEPQTNADTDFRVSPRIRQRQSALGWDDAKAVLAEHEKLSKEIFPDLHVAMLHGKMKSKEKEAVMAGFLSREYNILVSTSVVEVGVDIPNATIMMIEGAEHFGLAQLHQFRGRVGRSSHQSYCLLCTDSPAKTANQRMRALLTARSGFELAEKDLNIRGPGDFYGLRQAGLPDLTMASLEDLEIIGSARREAQALLKEDQNLQRHPALLQELERFRRAVHFE